MPSVSREFRSGTIESERAIAESVEQSFVPVASVLSSVSRTLWPVKTAAHLAAASNCSVRAAEMYIAGDRDWSGDAIAAIVAEILKRHRMRNVKITKR